MTDLTEQNGDPGRPQQAEDAAPTKRLRLLVVDDHEVVRQGLAALLSTRDGFQVVAEAADPGADDGHVHPESAMRKVPDATEPLAGRRSCG